jgi:hypothetical protein
MALKHGVASRGQYAVSWWESDHTRSRFEMIFERESNIVNLGHWMEIVGALHGIDDQEGTLFAVIGGKKVVLPLNFKEILGPYIGRKIAVLRTDIPGKEYLVKVLPEPGLEHETTSMTTRNVSGNEQILNFGESI